MKRLFILLLTIALLISCEKKSEVGKVIYKINFTTDPITLKSSKSDAHNLYTNFGDYVTSLTPTKLTAQIWTIGYVDTVMVPGTGNSNMLQYLIQSVTHLPLNDPSRIVDFSNKVAVTFNPQITEGANNEGQFNDKQIDFIYFFFMPRNFYQIVQLPEVYNNIKLDMFPPDSLVNNVLKISQA